MTGAAIELPIVLGGAVVGGLDIPESAAAEIFGAPRVGENVSGVPTVGRDEEGESLLGALVTAKAGGTVGGREDVGREVGVVVRTEVEDCVGRLDGLRRLCGAVDVVVLVAG